MIGGFAIHGDGPRTFLIRGVGKTLSSWGVPIPLQDPVIEIVKNGQTLFTQDNWGDWSDSPSITQCAIDYLGAFNFSGSDNTSASIIVELDPGNYGVLMYGKSGGTGNGMLEIYLID